jgi:hypothetical protein
MNMYFRKKIRLSQKMLAKHTENLAKTLAKKFSSQKSKILVLISRGIKNI